jgi:dynein heavy chain
VVPTADTARHMWVMSRLIFSRHHVLCIGGSGSGKTATINLLLRHLRLREAHSLAVPDLSKAQQAALDNSNANSEDAMTAAGHPTYHTKTLQFSTHTTAEQTQRSVEACLGRRRKGLHGPPVGSQLVVFTDDMNVPSPDPYGTSKIHYIFSVAKYLH